MNARVVGKLISERRKRVGLDQRSLAEIAGVSIHALSDVETGKGNPTLKVLTALGDSLGMELSLQVRTAPPPEEGR